MPRPADPTQLEQIGRYVVRRFLAEGGMSWVFEVTDPEFFDKRQALKLMKPDAAVGDEARRFEAEVRALALTANDNLVGVFDFGVDEDTGYQFYTMELLEGSDLSDVVPDWLLDPDATRQPGRTHSLEDICGYFDGVLSALAALHAQGIFHRDVKPENIYLTADGKAKLGDLGIAKGVSSAGVTQAGRVPGTPRYMSPEQSMGEPVQAPSDLFSLGLSLYRVLAGRTVYETVEGLDSTNTNKVLRHLWQVHGGRDEFEFDFPPAVPEPMREVVRRACRMESGERYPDAASMRDALRIALRAVERGDYAPPRARRRRKRDIPWRPWAAAVGAVALLAVAYFAGVRVLDDGRAEAATARAVAETQSARLEALMSSLAEVSDAAARDARVQARTGLELAGFSMREALRDQEDANYVGAVRRFDDASRGYANVCSGLADNYLEGAAATETRLARDASARIPEAARRFLSEPMAKLDRRLLALESELQSEGCERAKALDDRIIEAAAIVASIDPIREGLADRLPALAEAELDRAEEGRSAAQASSSGDRAYRQAMGAGERQLKEARTRAGRERFDEAIDSAKLAVASFERAGHVTRCSELAGAADALVQQAERADAAGLTIGMLRRQHRAAAELRDEGAFDRCAEEYRTVVDGLEALLAASEPALEAYALADSARSRAREAEVPSPRLEDCVARVSDCRTGIVAKRFSSAAEDCGEAERACDTALSDWEAYTQDQKGIAIRKAEEDERRRQAQAKARSSAEAERGRFAEALERIRTRGLPVSWIEARRDEAEQLFTLKQWEDASFRFAQLLSDLEELERAAEPVLAAREAARLARDRALAEKIRAPLLDPGNRAFAVAEVRFKSERFDEAEEEFARAREAFVAASAEDQREKKRKQQTAAAERQRKDEAEAARAEATAKLEDIAAKGLAPNEKLRRYYEAALQDLRAARYRDAAYGFSVVTNGLTGLLERADPVLAKRSESTSARSRLAGQGASRALLERADGIHERGDAALERGELDAAGRSYDEAVAAYADARGAWVKQRAAIGREQAASEQALAKVEKVRSDLGQRGVGLGPLATRYDSARAAHQAGRYTEARSRFDSLLPALEQHGRLADAILEEGDSATAVVQRVAAAPGHRRERLEEARGLVGRAREHLASGSLEAARAGFRSGVAAAQSALPTDEDFALQTVRNWNACWNGPRASKVQERIALCHESWAGTAGREESLERLFKRADVTQEATIGGVQKRGSDQFELELRYDRVVDYPDRSPRRSQKSGRVLVARVDGRWQIPEDGFSWE